MGCLGEFRDTLLNGGELNVIKALFFLEISWDTKPSQMNRREQYQSLTNKWTTDHIYMHIFQFQVFILKEVYMIHIYWNIYKNM